METEEARHKEVGGGREFLEILKKIHNWLEIPIREMTAIMVAVAGLFLLRDILDVAEKSSVNKEIWIIFVVLYVIVLLYWIVRIAFKI